MRGQNCQQHMQAAEGAVRVGSRADIVREDVRQLRRRKAGTGAGACRRVQRQARRCDVQGHGAPVLGRQYRRQLRLDVHALRRQARPSAAAYRSTVSTRMAISLRPFQRPSIV